MTLTLWKEWGRVYAQLDGTTMYRPPRGWRVAGEVFSPVPNEHGLIIQCPSRVWPIARRALVALGFAPPQHLPDRGKLVRLSRTERRKR